MQRQAITRSELAKKNKISRHFLSTAAPRVAKRSAGAVRGHYEISNFSSYLLLTAA